MRTQKSQQQQLARESENALKGFFENEHAWIVTFTAQQEDYGTDGQVLIFENDEHNQKKFDFQLKATSEGANEKSVQLKHLDMWRNSVLPFYIFFWNKTENQLYFLNVHQYYGDLSRSNPDKLKQDSIRMQFTE